MTNVQDLFAEKFTSENFRQSLMTSAVWPAAVEFINTAKKAEVNVKIAEYDPLGGYNNGTPESPNAIYFITEDELFVVGCIYKNVDNYYVNTLDDVIHMFTTNQAKSTKPQYLARTMRKEGSPVRNGILNAVTEAKRGVNTYIHRLNKMIADLSYGESITLPTISMYDSTCTALLAIFKGRMQPHELQQKHLSDIDRRFQELESKTTKFARTVEDMREFYATNKRLIVRGKRGQIVTGVVSNQPLLATIDFLLKHGEMPHITSFNHVQIVEPFRFYGSFDDIPAEIKSQMEMQLTMLKIVRNSEDMFPVNGGKSEAFMDARAATMSNYSGMQLILLDN